jgi:hypothetical protein
MFCRICSLALLLLPAVGAGALVTSIAGMPSPSVLALDASAGPRIYDAWVDVGPNVQASSTNPDGSHLGVGPYDLADNGIWSGGDVFAGVEVDLIAGTDPFVFTFRFPTPFYAVGGWMNYSTFPGSGFSDVIISALDQSGAVLEEYNLTTDAPILTPGAVNAAEFRGIARNTRDIYGFSIANSAAVIRNLTVSEIPEPGTAPLTSAAIAAALGAAAAARRRP